MPAAPQGPKEVGDIDTDDEKDEEAEYEQWKSRELRRIRCGAPPLRLRLVAGSARAAELLLQSGFLKAVCGGTPVSAIHILNRARLRPRLPLESTLRPWCARRAADRARRRDREEREREAAEAEQREALRNMTDAERRAWEAAHPKEHADAPKKKWRFLQKYWHKGAFFQDVPDAADKGAGGDEIFGRDFSAPTGDDKMDKTVLPKARAPALVSPPFGPRESSSVCPVGVRTHMCRPYEDCIGSEATVEMASM